ncbi:MAG: siderophore-interacting protein, partial [Pseudomonadota bacterium]
LNQRLAHVQSSYRSSPNFQRVRLEGDFSAFLPRNAGLHFRLLFGPDGCDWPTRDDRGVTHWPGGAAAWHKPVFTVRAIDPNGAWIDTDIALHAGGRTTEWCQGVQPGAEMAITGPNGGAIRQAGWLGLIGDETALPVICRMLEAAPPDTRGDVILFLRDAADAGAMKVPNAMNMRVEAMHEADPVDALQALSIPDEDCYVFFAAERAQVSRARTYLKEAGLASRAFTAASYWTASTA